MKILSWAVALAASGVILAVPPSEAQEAENPSGTTEAMIVRMEQEVLDAIVREDREAMNRLLAPDLLFASEEGSMTWSPQSTDELFAACQTADLEMDQVRVISITLDVVVITSRATGEQICGETKRPPVTQATSVWQRRAGRWMVVAHTEASVGQ